MGREDAPRSWSGTWSSAAVRSFEFTSQLALAISGAGSLDNAAALEPFRLGR